MFPPGTNISFLFVLNDLKIREQKVKGMFILPYVCGEYSGKEPFPDIKSLLSNIENLFKFPWNVKLWLQN